MAETARQLELLAARALEQAGVRRLPVQLRQLADWMGVPLYTYRWYAETAGITQQEVARRFGPDGFTQQLGPRLAVFYQNRGHVGRMRWTLAHELAHILLGHLAGGDRRGQARAEWQADTLAAALLCPRGVVERCGCRSSSELAALCDVSQAAAQCRYRELWREADPPWPASREEFIEERLLQRLEDAPVEVLPRRCSRRI